MTPTPLNSNIGMHRENISSIQQIESDELPTMQVSVFRPSSPIAGSVNTPPPSGARKLSPSAFSQVARDDSTSVGTPLQIGDRFLGFELVEELGQGAFARVFLARQESLARRPVALKVTMRPTREAEKLARLQHTHIVPVYSVHDSPPVQLICMPYLGRRTIADLLRAYRNENASRGLPNRKTSGTRPAKSTAFTDPRSNSKSTPPSGSHVRPLHLAVGENLPVLIGDPIAVLQVLNQLAAGLAHAHERGILHLDLKPANVLLADTGEPMLLDFNLSFDTADPERELVGGTVPYMSVEQLQDLRTKGKGQVDARTDLYSLGVMAFEMLTGTVPFPASFLADIDGLIAARKKGPPSLRALNPNVTPAVESMVRKLLAADPKDRYQSASDFQTDVERHLINRPLAFARETSFKERFVKWNRRNPRLAGRLLATASLALAIAMGGVAYSRAETNAKAQAVERMRDISLDLNKTRIDLIIPGDQAARKRGIARAAAQLKSYGLPDDPNWAQREEFKRLSESDRLTLSGDLGEMLLLLAQARWQEVEGHADPERREIAALALKLNNAARGCFTPGTVPELLARQSSELARFLGEQEEPTEPREINREDQARNLFLNAATEFASARYSAAIDFLERTISDQPGHAAAHFLLAYCREKSGQIDQSLERYDAAKVLMPSDPRPAFQRGYIYALREKPQLAEAEYSRAISLNSEYSQAYRNRAVVRKRMEKLREAEEDLTTALALGSPAIQIHILRAEVREKLGDIVGAKADRTTADKLTPNSEGDYLIRGLSLLGANNPRAALDDFQAALVINPHSLPAFQNRIVIFADRLEKPDLASALDLASQGCKLFPECAPIRTNRAIILARLKRRVEAHQEIERAFKIADDADVNFRAACVYALTSSIEKDDQKKALEFLRKAIRNRYRDVNGLMREKDLESLRNVAEFRDIVNAANTLK